MTQTRATAPTGRHPGHEHADLNGRAVSIGVFSVVAGILIVALASGLLTRCAGSVHRGAIAPAPQPAIRLSSDPRADLRAYRAAKHAESTGYAWIDREQGIARVPIDRAMELLVEREQHRERAP